MPLLELEFPKDDDEGQEFVYKIAEFLKSLDEAKGESEVATE
jgi:hypothetical protein